MITTTVPRHADPTQSDANISDVVPFDTCRLVERLEKDGFTRDQAEAVMNALAEVVDERFGHSARLTPVYPPCDPT
jgi:hypothetical protein